MSIVLVQSGLEPSRIGDFEWFLYLANVVSFFWSIGLKNAFMSYFPKLNKEDQSALFSNLGFILFILSLIGFGVVFLLDLPMLSANYDYLPWLFCYLVLGTTASITENFLIVKDKSLTLFVYGLISYSVYLIGLSALIIQFDSVQTLFIGLGVWACLRFGYFLYLVYKYGQTKLDLKLVQRFTLFGFPLIIHVLLGGGMEYIDGYLVEHFYDRSDFAFFRYGARELPINTIFISAMASAFIPLAVANFTKSMEEIKRRTTRLIKILFPVSMVLMVCSPYLYTFFYSEDYLVSAHIFNIYLLIISSRILLPQLVIYAKHKNSVLMIVSLVEFIINIGLSIYLLQYFDLYGIAFATVIAFIIQKFILVFYSWKVLGVPVSEYLDVKKYIFYTVALYVTFFICINFL